MKTTTVFLLSLMLMTGGKKDTFSNKSIEHRMVKVAPALFANKYETTNEEYRIFLDWVKTENPDLLETVSVAEENWEALGVKNRLSRYYSEHQAFDDYPVVNVSYEGATAFCEWLTDKYNSGPKKKYEEVKFRLPTEAEWRSMATAGRDYSMGYPWGGPYMKNAKGCYLANFYNVSDHMVKIDINDRSKVEIQEDEVRGALVGKGQYLVTAPVNAFIATGAGLHNLSGNVAEMMAEKGRTKGGSWGGSGYYLRIDAEDEFEGFTTSPYVGFRYVMEVIKE